MPSVLAQLACDVRVLRAVARTVFRPVPNVDSVLLGLTSPLASDRRRSILLCAALSTTRSPTAARRSPDRSRSLRAPVPGVRERARDALEELGFPPDVRAERLSPEEFRALARALA